MSQKNAREETPGESFWIRAGSSVALNVLSGLLATGIIAVLVAGFVSFSRISPGSSSAFRFLLAAVSVGVLISVVSALVMIRLALTTQAVSRAAGDQTAGLGRELADGLSALSREITTRLESLDRQIPSIDWSFDAAEHGQNVYRRITKAVEDEETMEFKVLTVFRDVKTEEVGDTQRLAIQEYYQSLERALVSRRGFVYERLVVLRPAIGRRLAARELLARLLLARPDFVEHSRWLMKPQRFALGSRCDLRFYGDTGRLFDIGFAVALDRERKPLSLLLEIGTTRPGAGSGKSEHPVLGLIVIEKPSSQLAEAFLLDHQSLRTENMAVDHIPEGTVREVLGL